MKTTLLLSLLQLPVILSAASVQPEATTDDPTRAIGMLVRDVPEPSSLAILIGLGFLVHHIIRKQRAKAALAVTDVADNTVPFVPAIQEEPSIEKEKAS